MKLAQHIKVGKTVLESLDSNKHEVNYYEINRFAFLFGCIAPDLNCVYPAHRLSTTERRFYKKLKQVTTASLNIFRSFELGVMTHYICDYFCYAHNNESLGGKHKKYESNLYSYYNVHIEELKNDANKLLNKWLRTKRKVVDDVITTDTLTYKEQCDVIIKQVKLMNDEYLKDTSVNQNYGWWSKEDQLEYDLRYIIFMAQHIAELAVEPFKCMVLDT